MLIVTVSFVFFFFNDTATTEIYTLSLHDALPISFNDRDFKPVAARFRCSAPPTAVARRGGGSGGSGGGGWERTRLNSRHGCNSDSVFWFEEKSKRPPRPGASTWLQHTPAPSDMPR